MSYKVAIIGAGWYGCHIAMSLLALGFDVTVFEKNARPLHEASGNNQFRLHMGFHYPRHYATRMQSRDGFMRFIERYPELTTAPAENIYAVPERDTLIDFLTYRLIMTSSGIDFSEPAQASVELRNIEGLLLTSERVLHPTRARLHFQRRLGDALVLGHQVKSVVQQDHAVFLDGEAYDYVIDASWGHFRPLPTPLIYEPTLLLYYEAREAFPAITLVDGPLCSVYPTEDPAIYTLSSVVHTPLGRFDDGAAARHFLAQVSSDVIADKIAAMEAQIGRYVTAFNDGFRYIGPQFAIKTKPVGAYDDRSCQVFKDGRLFSVLSGKIDTVFFAVERILSYIQASHGSEFAGYVSPFREELRAIG